MFKTTVLTILLVIFTALVDAVFTPKNKDELKAALDACIAEDAAGACTTYTTTTLGTRGCGSTCGPVSDWDITKVTDLSELFKESTFNQDISKWDVSRVTSLSSTFLSSTEFNQDISAWNIGNVVDFQRIFHLAAAFNFRKFVDLKWRRKTWLVQYMDNMYSGGCAMDETCGFCGKRNSPATSSEVSTASDAVECPYSAALPPSTPCIFCDASECCEITCNAAGSVNKVLETGTATGQEKFTTPGTHFWIAPVGVTHVSVVAVGGGGTSGGGGGLGWKNNIEVVPGDTYTIVVGAGGDAGAMNNGLDSYFISVEIVKGGGKKKKERRNVFIKNFFFFIDIDIFSPNFFSLFFLL